MKEFNRVFIIGVSRTGSKFYMQLLNSHKNIQILPEMLFKHPLKIDLFSLINKHIDNPDEYGALIDSLYSNNLKESSFRTLHKVDKELFLKEIQKHKLHSPYQVLDILLELIAKNLNIKYTGVKFPVHYSFLMELKENIPNSRFLFLTRDPREIYVSHLAKKRKRIKEQKDLTVPFRLLFLRITMLTYTVHEWTKSIGSYEKFVKTHGSDTINIFKYEDILKDQNLVLSKVAQLLGIDQSEFSLNDIRIVGSSFNKAPKLNRWKKELTGIEKLFFKLFVKKRLRSLGYD